MATCGNNINMTRTELETELARCITTRNLYLDARDTIATSGTSYELTDGDSTRKLTRANLSEVQSIIDKLDYRIDNIREKLASPTLRSRKRVFMVRGV